MHIITGNNGFVGGNLTHFLKNHHLNVLGVSRNPEGENEIPFEKLTVAQCKNAASIIHLAGKAHDLKKTANEIEYFEINTELTKQLFDTFLQSDCPVFIYMSSVKAVADAVCGVLSEDIMPNPITPYGKSKLAAENYILSKKISSNKRLYILRSCMIHGPGNKGNLNLLYKIVSKNIPWLLGAFYNKRSFCSIDNLLFVIKELIEREDIPSGIYNIADDEPLSTNELISLIAESQNRKPNVWKIPKGFIEGLAKLGYVLHLPLNTERLQKLTDSYVISNQKIKDAIGKSLPVSSRDGLFKTFKSFK